MKLRFLSLLLAVGLLPSVAHAAEADPLQLRLTQIIATGGLTADAAAARALKVDPQVARRDAVIAERVANVTTTELGRVPQLTAALSYTRLSEVDMPELTPGLTLPQVLDNYSIKLELSVPLSDYLLRFPALVEASELRLKAAKIDRRTAELDAANRARRAYWQWVRAELRVVVSEQSLTQVSATTEQMRARVEAQRASRADLLRIQAQEADARRGLFAAREQARFTQRQLRQLIGAGPDEVLTIGEDVMAVPVLPALGSIETQVGVALKQRSEVASLDLAIAAIDRNVDATRAGLFPRLDAFGQANYDNPNSRILLGGDEFNGSWAVGLRLSWKLNDALSVDPAIDAARAQIAQLRADRDTLARGLEIAIADATRAVKVAVETRATTVEAKAAAEESYRIRKELLAADRATAVELVDAESELTRTRIQEIDALIDLRIALSDLDYALGN